MTTFTLDITGDYIVTSRNVECVTDRGTIPASMIQRIFDYGWDQVISDAASSAMGLAVKDKFGDKALPAQHKEWCRTPEATAAAAVHGEALMAKKRDAILAGEWSTRGTGTSGVDEFTSVARSMVKAYLKDAWGGESPKWKDLLAASDMATKLDKVYADNEAVFKPLVETQVAERKAARERKAGLKGKVTINL